MPDKDKNKMMLASYQDEINSAYLYKEIAKLEKTDQLKTIYGKMAAEEERHAAYWNKQLTDSGVKDLPTEPDNRVENIEMDSREIRRTDHPADSDRWGGKCQQSLFHRS